MMREGCFAQGGREGALGTAEGRGTGLEGGGAWLCGEGRRNDGGGRCGGGGGALCDGCDLVVVGSPGAGERGVFKRCLRFSVVRRVPSGKTEVRVVYFLYLYCTVER